MAPLCQVTREDWRQNIDGGARSPVAGNIFFPPLLSTRPQPWHRELHLHPMAEVPSFWLFTALVENFLPAHSTFEKSWQLRYSTHSPVNAESIPNHAVHFTNFSVCEMVFLAYFVLSLSTRLEQNACSYSHE